MRSSKPILLVEDDQVDAMTVKRALKAINVINRLDIVNDGEAALNFLEKPFTPEGLARKVRKVLD